MTEAYDGALDQFERGMTASRLDAIIAKKAAEPECDAPHPALAFGAQWTVAEQEKLCREVAGDMGYSFENGRLDVSTHPFTGGAGPTDVRITTRFSENWEEGFGATVHETGHALYEQGRDTSEEGAGLPSSVALSMGTHESQSLLWERMVLQSRPFWEYAAPKLHARFPFTQEASADDFYRTYNRVSPGPIRVEADEVSYPLHVVLRYEIERALFKGELSVEELPSLWNSRMKSDLGVDISDDAQGVLQDIHWSLVPSATSPRTRWARSPRCRSSRRRSASSVRRRSPRNSPPEISSRSASGSERRSTREARWTLRSTSC